MSTSQQKNQPKSEKAPAAPKRPVELATKNDTLKCLVVVKDKLTYFGTKDKKTGEMKWRITVNPKRLFDRVELINGDATLDATKREKKVLEAFNSLTSPVPSVSFDAKTEAEQDFKKQEVPVEAATVKTDETAA